jgi:hypothetical protein
MSTITLATPKEIKVSERATSKSVKPLLQLWRPGARGVLAPM